MSNAEAAQKIIEKRTKDTATFMKQGYRNSCVLDCCIAGNLIGVDPDDVLNYFDIELTWQQQQDWDAQLSVISSYIAGYDQSDLQFADYPASVYIYDEGE